MTSNLRHKERKTFGPKRKNAKDKEIIVHEGETERREGQIFEKEKVLRMNSIGRKLKAL